jgi:hypothetical protein
LVHQSAPPQQIRAIDDGFERFNVESADMRADSFLSFVGKIGRDKENRTPAKKNPADLVAFYR